MESSYRPEAVIVAMSPEDLETMIRRSVRTALDEQLSAPVEEPRVEGTDYLTREETCQLLHVSLMTLRKYEKRKELVPCRFGRRVLYRKGDVDTALARSRR